MMDDQSNQKSLNSLLLLELQPLILENISSSYIATEFVSLNNERQIYYEHFI